MLAGRFATVKSGWPTTRFAAGSTAPDVREAAGKRSTRLLPASTTNRLPALSNVSDDRNGPFPSGQPTYRQMVMAESVPPWLPRLDVNLSGCPMTISGVRLEFEKGAG